MSERGVVVKFLDQKGFGFIKPSNGDDDVYVHANNVSGEALGEGDEVRYDVEVNERNGKTQAVNVTGGSGNSRGGGRRTGKTGESTGTVTRFYDGRGYGFIRPDEGGEELFVSRDDVFGGGLLDGDAVTYDETTNQRNGKLKAVNVSGGTGGSSWGKARGKGYGGSKSDGWNEGRSEGGESLKSKSSGKGKRSDSPPRVLQTGRAGTVAVFLDRKGFGFIKPDESADGSDLVVLREDVIGGGLLDGDRVVYALAEDPRSSKMRAVNVMGGTGGERWGRPGQGKGDRETDA